MTARDSRRRRTTRILLAVTAVTVVLGPLLGYAGARAVLSSTGGKDAKAKNLPVQTFPATPTALYLTTDPAGKLSSVSVVVLDPSLRGGSVVSVPLNSDVGFNDDARQSLQQVFADAGAEGAKAAAESLLLVNLDQVEVSDAAQTADLFKSLSAISVVRPGLPTLTVDPAEAARLLTAAPPDTATGQAEHRADAEAVWAGVASAVGNGQPTSIDTMAMPTNSAEVMAHLFAGPVRSRGLATSAFSATQIPGNLDVVQVDRSDVVMVFASIAPGSMSAPSPGLLFRLEAPTGYEAAVKRTVDKLLYLGAHIVSIAMSVAPRPATVFLVPDSINRSQAEHTNAIFVSISFVDPNFRIDGVDLTIVLGTDYLSKATS